MTDLWLVTDDNPTRRKLKPLVWGRLDIASVAYTPFGVFRCWQHRPFSAWSVEVPRFEYHFRRMTREEAEAFCETEHARLVAELFEE